MKYPFGSSNLKFRRKSYVFRKIAACAYTGEESVDPIIGQRTQTQGKWLSKFSKASLLIIGFKKRLGIANALGLVWLIPSQNELEGIERG
jgi:hypothetical protein